MDGLSKIESNDETLLSSESAEAAAEGRRKGVSSSLESILITSILVSRITRSKYKTAWQLKRCQIVTQQRDAGACALVAPGPSCH
mmetsp:Transcript_28408/g.64642  ORF Transcript_28408/g.64642 Transcript_28408/m.64642 type:complete len:85 (-) Transcript_28408:48-302(-)